MQCVVPMCVILFIFWPKMRVKKMYRRHSCYMFFIIFFFRVLPLHFRSTGLLCTGKINPFATAGQRRIRVSTNSRHHGCKVGARVKYGDLIKSDILCLLGVNNFDGFHFLYANCVPMSRVSVPF